MPADARKKMSGWFWFALYSSLRTSIFPDTRQPCPDCACSESLDEGSIAPRRSDDALASDRGGKEGEMGESTSARPYLCCYRAHSMPMHPQADL